MGMPSWETYRRLSLVEAGRYDLVGIPISDWGYEPG